VNPRLYRVPLWFGMAAAGPAHLQEVLKPFAAAFTIGYLLRAEADRLELYGTRRMCADLAA
jgi:hypothetical protein